MEAPAQFTAFDRSERLASGSRTEVIEAIRAHLSKRSDATVLAFDDETGAQIDFDLREGKETSSASRTEETRGPGRPKLGVVAREVTLLPRHWDWLARQPGGASVTLRKLIDEARRTKAGSERTREAQERAYRFMSAMAGNLLGFEEACRALFAKDRFTFETLTATWPRDVRVYACALAEGAFAATG